MTPKARVIPCIDVMDCPRRPLPHGGEGAQTKKEAVR
jgi:hypothetical protein